MAACLILFTSTDTHCANPLYYHGSPGLRIERLDSDDNHSLGAKVKNVHNTTSTPSLLVACCLDNSTLLQRDQFLSYTVLTVSRDSSVSIATGYGLDGLDGRG
jgi:hypothetical protein